MDYGLLWRVYLGTAVAVLLGALISGWQGAVIGAVVAIAFVYWRVRAAGNRWGAVEEAARAILDAPDGPSGGELEAALGRLSGPIGASMGEIARYRHRLLAILAATLDGIVAVDSDMQITFVNQAARRLLGWHESKGRRESFHQLDRTGRLLPLAEQAVASESLCTEEFSVNESALRVDATPLRTHGGAVLVLHDVTEMRRLETLRQDFVANVSHELKTPLTAIRAYVETLLDGGINDADNNLRFLGKIDFHSARLARLITDLLTLSKLESEQPITMVAAIDLVGVLRESEQRVGVAAEEKQIRVQLEVPAGPVLVLGDEEAVQQIFDNLIDNAVKYTEPSGKVIVSTSTVNGHVQVNVRDTGMGIPPEDLPRVFERFYRVGKARSRELGGTGLGLAIVKHYVQALNGEISVESTPGEGSTFKVRLPAAE